MWVIFRISYIYKLLHLPFDGNSTFSRIQTHLKVNDNCFATNRKYGVFEEHQQKCTFLPTKLKYNRISSISYQC